MYKRALESSILRQLSFFPVVAILGPRQSGKTTLAKQVMKSFNGAHYLDMESPADQRKIEDPELYLNSHSGKLIVIDEIQHRPELFPLIRSFVDRTDRKSPLIILGSASQELIRQGGETLAGRIALTELSPLTVVEVDNLPINEQWLRGGFPGSITAPDNELSLQWREYFIRTFLERDLPMLGLRLSLSSLQRLLLLMAHNHGTLINLSKTGELFGVSHTQMRNYLGFLTGSFLLRALPPCEPNLKKQIVRTPKIYYRDSGLLHSVLSIDSFDELLGNTIAGESWEGFVIEQVLSSVSSRWKASFYRTRQGAELDIVLEKGQHRIGVECKMHTAPSVTRGFWNCLDDLSISPEQSWIVCPIDDVYPYKNGVRIGGIRQFIDYIKSLDT